MFFVTPAILLAYLCACPLLYLINSSLFLVELSGSATDFWIPSTSASCEVVALGFVLPIIFAVTQAQRAQKNTIGEVLRDGKV